MEYLAITIHGSADKQIFTEVSNIASSSDCHILRSQGMVIGSDAAFNAVVEGHWNCVAKFEAAMEKLKKKFKLDITMHRTELTSNNLQLIPYVAQIIALDQPDMLYNMVHFFSGRGISIETLQCDSYRAGPTHTPMLNVNLAVNLNVDINIADLREQFMLFCDEFNIDGILEPERR